MSSGTQTSILMYADDSVLLASSIEKSLAIDPGGGGGVETQSRKGYRVWPDCRGAVAVASKNC